MLSSTTRHTHAMTVAEMGIAPIQTKNSSDPYQLRPIPMCTHNITLRLAMPSCPCIRVVLLVDVSHVELSHVKTAFCVCLCVSSGTSTPQIVLCMFHWLPYTCYRVASDRWGVGLHTFHRCTRARGHVTPPHAV